MTSLQSHPSCPCCTFLPDDLFLPKNEKGREDEKDTKQQDAAEETDEILSLQEAWERLQSVPCVVDTHGHAHLERESSEMYELPAPTNKHRVLSLTCAVQQADWQTCVEYASASTDRIAALGVHPWYLADLNDTWLRDLENLITEHPGTMVGEIGLCKMARFVRHHPEGKQVAMQIQRDVFQQQLLLAARHQRPVSIHCVQQQGVLMEIFKDLTDYPPAMALHSFSGTAHHVKQLLAWEASLKLNRPLLYFGFSHTVNYVMCTSSKARRQGKEAVRAVPPDRLLAESDVHSDADVLCGTVGAIAYLAFALEESIEIVAERTTGNALRFFQALDTVKR